MTESKTVAEVEKVADRYITLWNEPDAESRCHAVAGLWIEDGTYTDPLAAVEGWQAIDGVLASVREQFPGHVFKLIGNVDAHHNIARFGWELIPEDGDEPAVVGFDAAVIADDGRLRNVYGFLNKVPVA